MSTSEKMASSLPLSSRKLALLTVLPCMVVGLWESGFQEVWPYVRAGKGFIAALFFVGGSAADLAVQPHVKPYRIEFGLCLQPVIQRGFQLGALFTIGGAVEVRVDVGRS